MLEWSICWNITPGGVLTHLQTPLSQTPPGAMHQVN